MKKRVVSVVAICLIAAMICAFAVACDNKGLSAYELAVQSGYTGTLDEWLESLKGADGANGIDGVDGVDGKDGKDGLNGRNGLDGQDVSIEEIYQRAQAQGYGGTFMQFLQDYLSLAVKEDTISPSKALLSSVVVSCSFTYIEGGSFFQPAREVQATSSGSGVIYRLDKASGVAYIITNYHVVYSASATETTSTDGIIDDISIFIYGEEYVEYSIAAEYVGGLETYDIAVLKVEDRQITESPVRAVEIANSDEVSVGSGALVVGNAAGYGLSVTQGIVSVDSEYITISNMQYRVMRVDAAVNSGNSGGGLFDTSGRLIGIVNARSGSVSIENMGYAIPVNIAAAVAQNIIDTCEADNANTKKMSKIVLGIQVSVNSSRGVYDEHTLSSKIVEEVAVKSVESGKLADTAGLKADDIIKSVSINGNVKEITRTFQVVDMLIGARAGDTIEFVVSRVVVDDQNDLSESVVEVAVTFVAAAENFVKVK